VVDGYPAVEHLWALGREAFGGEAARWVAVGGEGRAGHPGVRGGSGEESRWSGEVARTAEYFRERRVQMESPAFRKAGYPIGLNPPTILGHTHKRGLTDRQTV
jgi:hypothetical protein